VSNAPSPFLVAQAWLTAAVPGPRVTDVLPPADAALRTNGLLRVQVIGGTPDRDVPLRASVVTVECWVAPPAGGTPLPPWHQAEALAERVLAATYAVRNTRIDLSAVGDITPARVLTVIAVAEPHRVIDPGGFARLDTELLLTWRADA
jgi:hypothetical protein